MSLTVTPHDIGTFLVSSRTEPEVEWLVDITTLECSCPGALEFAATSPDCPCAHVEAAMAFAHRAQPRQRQPFTFFLP